MCLKFLSSHICIGNTQPGVAFSLQYGGGLWPGSMPGCSLRCSVWLHDQLFWEAPMSCWVRFVLALSALGVLSVHPITPTQAQAAKETLAEEVVFFEEPNRSKAYEMLASGQMHIYAYGLSDPEIKKKIETSKDLTYTLSYGNTWELTLNPAGPVLQTGKLNPFAVAPIREALNWLIDRNYIAQELCFGLARPKFLPIVSAFPDYAKLADVARALEFKYAHTPGKTKDVLTREMPKYGTTLTDDTWGYESE